ncbi:MAG TPA: branched-chain amino acid ABC transporter permease, partial [Stellaceae bacterium]|nr:branched-chain amino acid ABC transporter permease [Stellaceae bacterium]
MSAGAAPGERLPRRAVAALALFAAAMLALPAFASNYVISLLIVALFAAYFGQAWNIMTGFAGQLSLGHALYVGLGAYTGAALFVHYGVPPWLGMIAGSAVAALAGSIIAALSFRFSVAGVYFALLTIAFAEFTRILFDHFDWVGATSGLFLPVANMTRDNLLLLRGSPAMFYYVLLAFTAASLAL